MAITLIDTSGSMVGQQIQQANRYMSGRVILFDSSGVRDIGAGYQLSDSDLGGGSVLMQAFKYVSTKFPGQPVTIVTDGFIFDAKEARAKFPNVQVNKVIGVGTGAGLISEVAELRKVLGC